MILMKIVGGLGNQLFQYSFARNIAIRNKCDLFLDLSWFSEPGTDTKRTLKLSFFNTHYEVKSNSGRLKGIKQYHLKQFFLKWIGQQTIHEDIPLFREKSFEYDPEVRLIPDNTRIEGYFQSEKYFSAISDIIRMDLTLKNPLQKNGTRLKNQIEQCNSASIHVRRGDFVNSKETNEYHGTCSLDYYRKAIEIIESKEKNVIFFIFSDDPKWVEENFGFLKNKQIISDNGSEYDYEDLWLMSLCKHHILANSSFSWWGAWLNEKEGAMVIAPNKWFNRQDINTKDLLPERWLTIPSVP